jgi:LysM repeat protein
MKVNFVGILIRLISDPFCQPPMSGRFKLFFCSVFLFLSFQFAAHAAAPVGLDSVGIQQIEGRVFIIHKVAYQETLFSISRRYKVQMSEIHQSNRILKQGLKEGQMLLVPYGQATSSLDSSVPSSTDASASSETSASTISRDTSSENAADSGEATSVDTPSPVPTIPAKNDKTTAPTVEAPATNSTKTAPAVTIQKVKITHKVKSGESLSTIAKKYKVSVAELKSWNSLSSDKLSIGKALKVITKKAVPVKQNGTQTQAEPLVADAAVKEEVKKEEPRVTDRKTEIPNETKEVVFVSTKSPSATTKATGDGISHTVKSGESLFLLAKMYGSSIEELIQWNGLTSNNIKVGQTLQVGRAATTAASTNPIAATTTTTTTTTPTTTTSEVVVEEVKSEPIVTVPAAEPKQESTAPNTSGGFTNTKESGLAEVIPGTEANKKYLVLHRNAPVGSVIRIKNEENDLTIFARVVGVLPETGDNSKVLIKLSKAAFEQLKGVNTRFPVEILY